MRVSPNSMTPTEKGELICTGDDLYTIGTIVSYLQLAYFNQTKDLWKQSFFTKLCFYKPPDLWIEEHRPIEELSSRDLTKGYHRLFVGPGLHPLHLPDPRRYGNDTEFESVMGEKTYLCYVNAITGEERTRLPKSHDSVTDPAMLKGKWNDVLYNHKLEVEPLDEIGDPKVVRHRMDLYTMNVYPIHPGKGDPVVYPYRKQASVKIVVPKLHELEAEARVLLNPQPRAVKFVDFSSIKDEKNKDEKDQDEKPQGKKAQDEYDMALRCLHYCKGKACCPWSKSLHQSLNKLVRIGIKSPTIFANTDEMFNWVTSYQKKFRVLEMVLGKTYLDKVCRDRNKTEMFRLLNDVDGKGPKEFESMYRGRGRSAAKRKLPVDDDGKLRKMRR